MGPPPCCFSGLHCTVATVSGAFGVLRARRSCAALSSPLSRLRIHAQRARHAPPTARSADLCAVFAVQHSNRGSQPCVQLGSARQLCRVLLFWTPLAAQSTPSLPHSLAAGRLGCLVPFSPAEG